MNLDNAVLAWIEYGDHDMLTANQQAAEKYLKAGLAAFSLPIPKTHDLLSLNRQLAPCFPKIAELEMDCDRLTDFGTVTRYPNESVVLDEGKITLAEDASGRICDLLRNWLFTK